MNRDLTRFDFLWLRPLDLAQLVGERAFSADGRVLLANPALLRMLGYDSLADIQRRDLDREGFEPTYPRSEFKQRIDRDALAPFVTLKRGGRAHELRRATAEEICPTILGTLLFTTVTR